MRQVSPRVAPTRPRVALMSYAMDNRQAKGTALYTRKLIEGLLKDDRFEWTLVHFDHVEDPLYSMAREIIIPNVRLPFGTRFFRTLLFFWKYRKENFDVIHWFQPRLYPFFWLAPARHIVVTAHGAGDITAGGQFPFSRKVFNFVMKHFNRAISAIVADSIFGKEEVVEWYGVIPGRVHTIYLGGSELYTPIDKLVARTHIEKGYGITGNFILDISRHVFHKNIPKLIEAYISLQQQGLLLPKLVIVGNKHQAYEQASTLALTSPNPQDIIFVNYAEQKDLNYFYSAAEMFVFPSLNEGFGLPIIEAFASGTPVITSNITSMPEIAGSAALLVDPTSSEDIAEKMKQLHHDDTLRKELIKRGLERSKMFSWSMTARSTMDLYIGVMYDSF